jgi:hypothetical protein
MLTLSDIERIENWTKGVMHIPIHIGANLQETIDLCADWRELKEQLDAARRDEADTETFFIVELEGMVSHHGRPGCGQVCPACRRT